MQAIPAVLSIVGTVASIAGRRQQSDAMEDVAGTQEAAAEQSRRIAEQNAAATEAETRESVRRERLASREAESGRRARAAASGGELTGSTATFLEEMSDREAGYIDWLQKAGESRAAIEREQGEYSYLQGSASAQESRARARKSRTGMLGDLARGGSQLWSIYNPAGI